MNDEIIELFKDYLINERNYSVNTSSSYITDINDLVEFINKEKIAPNLISFKKEKHAEYFIGHLRNKGFSSKSIARKISSLRSFYNFLL